MIVPPDVSYPGVYVVEVDSPSTTIHGVSTAVTAFVGRAARGPVGEPVVVSNFGEFQRWFGGLDGDATVAYAVRDFFEAGGSQAVMLRLFPGEGGAATLQVTQRAPWLGGEAGDALFGLTAASPGTWANTLRAWIDFEGLDDAVAARFAGAGLRAEHLFNLHLALDPSDGRPSEQETYRAVTLVGGTPQSIDAVLASGSLLARWPKGVAMRDATTGVVAHSDAGGAALQPGGAVTAATAGRDAAPLTVDDYVGDAAGGGFAALNGAADVNLICVPPDQRSGDTPAAVYAAAVDYALTRRAFVIIDAPARWERDAEAGDLAAIDPSSLGLTGPSARSAAVYFPRVRRPDPARGGAVDTFPVSGLVAGIYAQTDQTGGVWAAPAGLEATLPGDAALAVSLSDAANGILNAKGINCLRTFPASGPVVWGARTLAGADALGDDYRYVSVRRCALYIEESLRRGTQWAVFEPNDEPLWATLRRQVSEFLTALFQQGAFQGGSAKDAFFVKCDATTTTQADIDAGLVNLVVGLSPLKPAEFVVVYLEVRAGGAG